jgi:hypothetical protein
MERKLKIQPHITYPKNKLSNHVSEEPILTIKGKWFREAGFYPNDYVNLIINKKSITIKKL